jgi:hypothetical protein
MTEVNHLQCLILDGKLILNGITREQSMKIGTPMKISQGKAQFCLL